MPSAKLPDSSASASEMQKQTGNTAQPVPIGMGPPFALVSSLFFLWAMLNNLNDVLIRQFMKSFAISRSEAGS